MPTQARLAAAYIQTHWLLTHPHPLSPSLTTSPSHLPIPKYKVSSYNGVYNNPTWR